MSKYRHYMHARRAEQVFNVWLRGGIFLPGAGLAISTMRSTAIFLVLWAFVVPQTATCQWVQIPTIANGGIGCFLVFASRLYMSGGEDKINWTSDDGETWHDASKGLPFGDGAISMASIGNVLAAGFTYSGIFISRDSGASWYPCHTDTTGFFPRSTPSFFAMIRHGTVLFAGANSGLFRSSDSGTNWELDTNGFGVPDWASGAYSFAANDSMLLVGSPAEYVFRSLDDGNSWEPIRLTSDPSVTDVVQSLLVVGNVALAGTSGGLFRSSDLGATWEKLDTSLFYHGPLSMISVEGTVIAGIEYTIVKSTDRGLEWQPFSAGWPPGGDPSLLSFFDTYTFAGSEQFGLYRRPLSEAYGGDCVSSTSVVADESASVDFYDMLGRLRYRGKPASAPPLPSGFYIERCAGQLKKIWLP